MKTTTTCSNGTAPASIPWPSMKPQSKRASQNSQNLGAENPRRVKNKIRSRQKTLTDYGVRLEMNLIISIGTNGPDTLRPCFPRKSL